MKLLETLVSQALHRSTGYDAAKLVRKIGGKNLLLAGGALLAGGLAAEHFRRQGGTGWPGATPAAPPVGGWAPPPGAPPAFVPPPPPASPAGAAPPPVPPPPAAAVATSPSIAEHAVVRAMIAASLADGRMSEEERTAIRSRIGESGFPPDQIAVLHQDMVLPPGVDELAALATDASGRELLFRFAAVALVADRQCTPPERAWLDRLAAALGIDPAAEAAIEREIAEAVAKP